MHFTIEHTFPAPVDRVYDAFTDIERWPEVFEGIDSVEPADPDAGLAFRDGLSFRETRTIMRKQHTETIGVSNVQPGSGFRLHTDSCGVRYAFDHRFASEPDGSTRLVLSGDGEAYTARAKILSVVFFPMRGVMLRMMRKDLEDMARHLTHE